MKRPCENIGGDVDLIFAKVCATTSGNTFPVIRHSLSRQLPRLENHHYAKDKPPFFVGSP
jgi:hypothetical protein